MCPAIDGRCANSHMRRTRPGFAAGRQSVGASPIASTGHKRACPGTNGHLARTHSNHRKFPRISAMVPKENPVGQCGLKSRACALRRSAAPERRRLPKRWCSRIDRCYNSGGWSERAFMAGERRAGVSANRLLNGWKEIAAFFSKDERTVRRWAAAMDLPVHRVPGAKRAAVYAYAHDLERWLTKHREESNELFGTGEAGPPLETFDKTSAGGIVAGLPPDPARARRRPPGPVAAVGAFLLAGAVLAGGWYAAHPGEGRTSSSSAPHAQPYQPDADAEQLFLDGQYNLSTRRRTACAARRPFSRKRPSSTRTTPRPMPDWRTPTTCSASIR